MVILPPPLVSRHSHPLGFSEAFIMIDSSFWALASRWNSIWVCIWRSGASSTAYLGANVGLYTRVQSYWTSISLEATIMSYDGELEVFKVFTLGGVTTAKFREKVVRFIVGAHRSHTSSHRARK
jgi:hypothetical protein